MLPHLSHCDTDLLAAPAMSFKLAMGHGVNASVNARFHTGSARSAPPAAAQRQGSWARASMLAALAQSAGTALHAPHADAEAVIHLLQKALPLATRQELAQRDNCTRQQFLGQWDESGRLLLALLYASNNTTGSFVELGALNGVNLSNTIMLERCWGWRGLLVEANPLSYEELERSGRTAHKEHAAVCEAGSGNMTIALSRKHHEISGFLSSYVNGSMKRFSRYVNLSDTAQVPCARLDVLMKRADMPARVNFLSLDVEGAEFDVISTVDPARFDVVLVELDRRDNDKDQKVRARLTRAGLVRSNFGIWTSEVFLNPVLASRLPFDLRKVACESNPLRLYASKFPCVSRLPPVHAPVSFHRLR